MSVAVYIPAFLQPFAGGRSRVLIDAAPATVDELLAELWRMHPGVRDRVIDEQGRVRQHVNVFVDTESIRYTGGLATAVPDGCSITIVPAVSGG
jgi:molybdopterin synthase sulfur carrier subunit